MGKKTLGLQTQPTSEQDSVRASSRRDRVRALRGKYAFVPLSSEEFARQKHEEDEGEEQRR